MMIICIIWQMVPCTGQKPPKMTAGIDAARALHGTAGLHLGYGFAEHWSAEAGISTDFRQLRTSAMNEKAIHDAEFDDQEYSVSGSAYCTGSLSIRYWPYSIFNKTFIGIGAVFDEKGRMDAMLAAGYTFCVWKGILFTVSYGICLTEDLKNKRPDTSGISLSISYNF